MSYIIRPATERDCHALAPRLRAADVMEIQASGGRTPLDALVRAFKVSSTCLVGESEGTPFAIFGIAPTALPEVASLWMLGTDDILQHRKSLCREARRFIAKWHEQYPVLFNFVDARNVVHIAWLRWLGAVFIKRHPKFGVEKTPFLEFVIPHV